MDFCEKNCSQPDPDIAGIGGMVSFAIGAGFTIVLASTTLLLNIPKSPNGLDAWLSHRMARIIPSQMKINPKTAESLSKDFLLPTLFTSNDSQLLTGFVVLLAGWIHFARDLSVYHFSVIINMGWSASNSQLLAFFALRLLEDGTLSMRTRLPFSQASADSVAPGGRRNTQPRTPRRSKRSRGLLMISHALLLFAASTLQGHRAWDAAYLRPARCIAREWKPGGPPLGWMIANWLMLIWGYWSPVHRLFFKISPPKVTPDNCSETTVVTTSDASSRATIPKPTLIQAPIQSIRRLVDLAIALLTSMTLQIAIPVAWYISGLVELAAIRRYGTLSFQECGEDARKEYQWGFGQIAPTLYLLSLFLPALDAFRDYQDMKRARAD